MYALIVFVCACGFYPSPRGKRGENNCARSVPTCQAAVSRISTIRRTTSIFADEMYEIAKEVDRFSMEQDTHAAEEAAFEVCEVEEDALLCL